GSSRVLLWHPLHIRTTSPSPRDRRQWPGSFRSSSPPNTPRQWWSAHPRPRNSSRARGPAGLTTGKGQGTCSSRRTTIGFSAEVLAIPLRVDGISVVRRQDVPVTAAVDALVHTANPHTSRLVAVMNRCGTGRGDFSPDTFCPPLDIAERLAGAAGQDARLARDG